MHHEGAASLTAILTALRLKLCFVLTRDTSALLCDPESTTVISAPLWALFLSATFTVMIYLTKGAGGSCTADGSYHVRPAEY